SRSTKGKLKSLNKDGGPSMEVALERLSTRFPDVVEVAQLDLVDDLNEDFFATSYEMVHCILPISKFAARKLKRFIDLLARMRSRFSEVQSLNASMHHKIKTAQEKLKLSLEVTITWDTMLIYLRDSLEEAWRVADAAHNREVDMRSNVDYTYNDHQTKQVTSDTHKNTKDMWLRGVVFRERDRLSRELKEHQKRLETNRYYSSSLEDIIDEHRATISKQQLRVKTYETELFKLEHKLRLLVEEYDERLNVQRREVEALHSSNSSLRSYEKRYHVIKALNEKLKQLVERYSFDNFALAKSNHRQEELITQLKATVATLEGDNRILHREKQELIYRTRSNVREIKKKEEVAILLTRRFHQMAKKNNDLIEQDVSRMNEMTGLEKRLAITISKLEESTKQKEECERQKDKLRGEISALNGVLAAVRYDVTTHRARMQEIQITLDRAHISLDERDERIHRLNKERNEALTETNDLNKTIERLEENAAERNQKLHELQEQLQHKTIEFLQAKQQTEVLRSEKIMLQRSNAVCAQDRHMLQNINAKQAFQNNQLCSQLAAHEKESSTFKNQIDQLNNLAKRRQTEIHTKERQLQAVRNELQETKIRAFQLKNTVDEDERRFKQITIRLDEQRQNKNLVGHQMMRRNGELRLQLQKLSMMQMALSRGTMQYNQRLDDIRILKAEITNLRMSKDCMERAVATTANMRHEIVRLERQLVRERLNVAAFTNEMKHPYRIHRWRLMRGRDPQRLELIIKLQALLKRNIQQSVERTNLETKLVNTQRMYDALKQQLIRVADPKLKERLWRQQRINQMQSRKVKAMKAELAINEIDLEARDVIIDEYKSALR
ncbi:hypothetical protein KR093_009589, partial [Drosophila rubida]